MNARDELALELFIADNANQPREQSIIDWQWLNEKGRYAGRIEHYEAMAVGIMAAGYGKLADAWDAGSQAGWSDRTRSIMGCYSYEQEIANETPNPYRSAS